MSLTATLISSFGMYVLTVSIGLFMAWGAERREMRLDREAKGRRNGGQESP